LIAVDRLGAVFARGASTSEIFKEGGRSMSDEQQKIGKNDLYVHKERVMPEEFVHGDEGLIAAISDHIEKFAGPVEMVFHELVSDLVHIDVHWVKPTPERLCHTLVTSGMSERAMAAPTGAEKFRFAELAIHLPADWPMDMESWKDDRYYWPVRLLKQMARMPHEYQTWLCADHSIGDPNGPPLGPGTEMSATLVGFAPSLPTEFMTLEYEGRSIFFFTLIPLYREELQFKLEHGSDELYDLFTREGIDEIIDPKRKNVCAPPQRKPWWRIWN
jgi:hypothetical protein